MSAVVKAESRSNGAAGTPQFTMRWVLDWSALEQIRREWDELAGDALERSPSSESWMLLPALRCLASGTEVGVLLVYAHERSGVDAPARLCGVFPLESVKGYKGLPIRVLRIWNHCYSLFPAPLLGVDCAADSLRQLFRWVRDEWSGTTLVEFPELRSDSAFFRVLTDVLREDDRLSHVADIHTRAFFRPRATAEEYLGAIFTNHHRKEMKRQERRLSEMGVLRFGSVMPGDSVAAWLDEFIALELTGWKGKDGTAFGSKEGHRRFLEAVVSSAAQRDELMLLDLRLDGKPIAMKLNFVCGDGGYTFKIAFDETYSKYSPGILLELENIRRAHVNPGIRWLDSLALADHPMANRVWLDRTTVVSQLVAPAGLLGQLLLGLIPILRVLKRRLRGRA
jgi:hypothetical protein